ncbi:CCR4-NOT transcription complex subunit 10-like isoform X3 [Porites lutea]|uniref:CCR4-NOT transcription complex subunit 10-like isoform X3 n=1 Tax=Porites lutea TaxID=51062 RepID=UPI003CC6D5D9
MAENPLDSTNGLQQVENIPRVGVTDAERELANSAHVEFESKQFDRCLSSLSKLLELRKNDPKVQHNKTVAQFYHSHCTGPEECGRSLLKIRKQAEKESSQTGEDIDDIDTAYLLYNESIIYFHLRQYTKALVILERLFKIVEPIEETLGYKICFLLSEIYLTLYKVDKVHNVLSVLENMIFGSAKPLEHSQIIQGGLQAQLGPGGQSAAAALQPIKEVDESLKLNFHQHKARLNILVKSMKACKREIKTVLNTTSVAPEGLFLKSNFEYLRQNYRKSIKLLNSAPKPNNVAVRGQSVTTMYFNDLGCIHFQLQKYNLAAFYFRKALQENNKALSSLPLIDMNVPLSSRPLVSLGVSHRHEILYNLGIQLLFSGRPVVAFDCLVEAVQIYHTNPRLWLRLAECCIVAFQLADDFRQQCIRKSDVVHDVVGSGPHRKIVLSPQTTDKQCNTEESKVQSAAMPACTLAFASLCLQNALMLLKSSEMTNVHEAENILESHFTKEDQDSLSGLDTDASSDSGGFSRSSSMQSETSIPAPPAPPVKLRELPHLRCSILASSAYVALGLGDNVMALTHAQRLLSQSNLVGGLKFLGHLYAAEALIKLNRLPEAIMHLSTENINNITIIPPYNTTVLPNDNGDRDKEVSRPHACEKMYFPQSLGEARASFLVNLAGVYGLRSEFDKARKCLQQACTQGLSQELSSRVVLLAVYIELQSGNIANALQTIKRHQVLPVCKAVKVTKKTRGADIWKT